MAFVFIESACIPCLSMMEPKDLMEVLENSHFSPLRVMPAPWRQCSVAQTSFKNLTSFTRGKTKANET